MQCTVATKLPYPSQHLILSYFLVQLNQFSIFYSLSPPSSSFIVCTPAPLPLPQIYSKVLQYLFVVINLEGSILLHKYVFR
jgi:hypothetical protein